MAKEDHSASSPTPWENYQAAIRKRQAQSRAAQHWYRRMPRIGDKLPRLKHQRTRKLAVRLALLLGTFGLIILAMVYLISPLSHIAQVTVTGNHALSNAQVQRAIKIEPGMSLYQVKGHEQALQRRSLRTNDRLKTIRITFRHWNQVHLQVTEYPTAGYLSANGRYYEVLENGNIANTGAAKPKSGAPVYNHFQRGKTLQTMIYQYAQLKTNVKNAISEIQFAPTADNPRRVHLFMNDGNEVYATIDTFAQKMAYYPSIAQKMKRPGVVNLELGAFSYPFTK